MALVVDGVARALDVLMLCRELQRRAEEAGEPIPEFGSLFKTAQKTIGVYIANDCTQPLFRWPSAQEAAAYAEGVRPPVTLNIASATQVTFAAEPKSPLPAEGNGA